MTHRALMLLVAIAAGCSQQRRESPDTPTAGPRTDSINTATALDSLCGIVRVVGAEPIVMVELELSSGATERLSGDSTRTMRQLSGLGVCVMADRARTVSSFVVRSQGGEPAVDGVLVERTGAFVIRAANGTETSLTTVPNELRGEAGSRVWVVVDSAGRVKSFGVVR